jgi:glycerol-3-phosphate acyltransferase PlsY
MADVGQILVGALIGYVIGMFPSADLVTRLASRGRLDLRTAGSGNPGGLNAARVLGKRWGLLVIVLDVVKGALAGGIGLALGDAGAYAAGAAVIAGHCWPVYNGGKGGKGVAAGGGSFFTVFPPLVVIDGLVTGAVALTTRSSRLAIEAALVVWVASAALWWATDWSTGWGPEPGPGLLVYAVAGAAMIQLRFWQSARAGRGAL